MKKIPLTKPHLIQEDIEALFSVLKSGMLVQDKNVTELEQLTKNYLRVQHSIAVSSGTAALHLCLKALNISNGDEVIVPAFSFMATANVVELVGAKPVFVDIDLATFNIDKNKIEEKITRKTKAIIVVHEFGLPADVTKIKKIAENNSIKLIEDAACAFGSKENDIFVGSIGDLAAFSFHPRKNITTGEGGLITANIEKYADFVYAARNHGIQKSENKIEFIFPGYNYRMTDFQAALFNSQFKRYNRLLDLRRRIAEIYNREIDNSIFVKPTVPENKIHSWQTYHLLVEKAQLRDLIIKELNLHNIQTNYGAQCIPMQKYYSEKYRFNVEKEFPNSLNAYMNGLAIPIYPDMTKEEIFYVIKKLNNIKGKI